MTIHKSEGFAVYNIARIANTFSLEKYFYLQLV